MIENPLSLSEEEKAQRLRQDAFYMATSRQSAADSRTTADFIRDAKQIEAYLKGEDIPE